MKSVYPYRDIRYLDWWISNIDHSDEDCWEKCTIILNNGQIIGCTTVNDAHVLIDSKIKKFFSRGNTIVSPDQRGKGVSKEIYNRVNLYDNWFSVGITDIAWIIQPKYVKHFTPIRPINVYVSVNCSITGQIFRKIAGDHVMSCVFPDFYPINKHDEIKKVKDISQMDIPETGQWTSDVIEFIRDSVFFRKRYFDIYCSERYAIYEYLSGKKCIGYVVLRKIRYKNLDMLSLVDYRFYSRNDEFKAFKVASKMAKVNGIGLVLILSSRVYGFHVSPLTLRMREKLNCAIGMEDMSDGFNDMLITSADSDLDFVYYK